MKYRKESVVVEALQYTGHNGWQIELWSDCLVIESPVLEPTKDNPSGQYLQVRTLEGTMIGFISDWIIKGVKGVYACKPDIFELTYEPLNEVKA